MNKKFFTGLLFFIIFTTNLNASGSFNCLEWSTICKHSVEGKCLESEKVCTESKRTVTQYSAGCDLSNIMEMINQEHCNVVVKCNDPISVVGTCERGSGCYPGHYIDTCPSGYDLRNTGNVEQRDCAQYGQQGTMTVQKFEYGHFAGGSAMTLQGGGVTCQKYYSPRQDEDCAERLANGERPDYCYVNECADLAKNPRCTRVDDLGTTEYGNEPDVLSTDCVWIYNPGTGGAICTDDPNKIANLTDKDRLYDVKIEKYQCESTDVRNCQDKQYKMVCPDGSETLCQSKKTCLERQETTITETVEQSYTLTRDYTSETCIVENNGCNVYANDERCVAIQSSSSPPINMIGGTGQVSSGANGGYIITLGKIGDDYWSGWCTVYEREYKIEITDVNRIISAKLKTVKWDDFVEIYINEDLVYNGGSTYTAGNFPPETGSCWDPAENWTSNPNLNILSHLKNGVNTFKVRISVAEEGEGYAFFELKTGTQRTYNCYENYDTSNIDDSCTQQGEPLCRYWQKDVVDDTKAVCSKAEFYYECEQETTENKCVDYKEEIICQDQAISLPNVQMKNDNMTGFAESLGILGMLDDINSIWSGEYQYCSYGYFVNGYGGVYCNNCKGKGGFLCFNKKPEQQKAYEMNEKGLCHYLETNCTKKINLGFDEICIEHTRDYCCYDSKLARVIVEQAYQQLDKSWNTGCNGLTVDNLNKLDFSKMDFSEIEADIKSKIDSRTNKIDSTIKSRIENYYNDFTSQMDAQGAHPQNPDNK